MAKPLHIPSLITGHITVTSDLLMPWEIGSPELRQLKDSLAWKLRNMAMIELKIPIEDIVCRQLLPSDLRLEKWLFDDLTYSGQSHDQRWIGIYSIYFPKPSISASSLRVSIGGKVVTHLDTSKIGTILWMKDLPESLEVTNHLLYGINGLKAIVLEGYLSLPLLIPESTAFELYFEGEPPIEVAFGGYAVEHRGRKISP